MNRRQFLQTSTAAAAGSTFSLPNVVAALGPLELRPAMPIGLAAPEKELPGTASLKVANPAEVKILQLTDVHFFCDRDTLGEKADQQTLDDFKRLVDLHKPELLAVTGDLWHDNPDQRGAEFSAWAIEKVSSLGIPWLFTWGNHDELDDYAAAQVALTESERCLYRGGHSGGNYEVKLTDKDDSVIWQMVCLNTTNQGVQDAQEKWLTARAADEGRPRTDAFCFLHIPIIEYHRLWHAGKCRGLQREEVCTYGEDGSAFSKLEKLGGIKACFCGHDHVNDYGGSRDGIELVYGRASGHAGYGGDEVRKGGKLITLNTVDGSYAWKSVFADGTSWIPSA
ncbi:MAG: metallophosphoesterase [Verrucomicrobia bacterium]|nr:metallophosphoesterase [Verrucomicrobiota bacterium]